jgi:hypothetical protein
VENVLLSHPAVSNGGHQVPDARWARVITVVCRSPVRKRALALPQELKTTRSKSRIHRHAEQHGQDVKRELRIMYAKQHESASMKEQGRE